MRWMGARTRNTYAAAIVAFGNWCVETDRLAANHLGGLCKADVRSDRRRVRRALTEDEIKRLLKAARMRPVAEYGRETVSLPLDEKQGRSTWRYRELTWETLEAAYVRGRQALAGSPGYLAKQERLGLERMLIYKTMVLTGLRLGELASISVGQLHLDAPQPHAELLARNTKAGNAALIPLRHDVADDLDSSATCFLSPTTVSVCMSVSFLALRERAASGKRKRQLRIPEGYAHFPSSTTFKSISPGRAGSQRRRGVARLWPVGYDRHATGASSRTSSAVSPRVSPNSCPLLTRPGTRWHRRRETGDTAGSDALAREARKATFEGAWVAGPLVVHVSWRTGCACHAALTGPQSVQRPFRGPARAAPGSWRLVC